MEEIEVPLESVQETLHERAHHSQDQWMGRVALSSALVAALAAVAALLAGHHANEAMMEQISSSDSWSHYQAKSIKSTMVTTRNEILTALGKPSEEAKEKIAEYKKEQEEISREAKEKEEAAHQHLFKHVWLARAVTLFQITIAVSAISALTRRRLYWYVGMCFSLGGLACLYLGIF